MANTQCLKITVGVLALQGAFNEHIQCLRSASEILATTSKSPKGDFSIEYKFIEVRNEAELNSCDALIIPGGESTAISLVAQRSGLLEPLRAYVKYHRYPTWGTCAGLILLAESANRTKAGGQELIGGLDVRVNRNHFGRQVESFSANLDLPFLSSLGPTSSDPDPTSTPLSSQGKEEKPAPFSAIFIRAPIVEKLLPHVPGAQISESTLDSTVIAPSLPIDSKSIPNPDTILSAPVEVLATLPGRTTHSNPEIQESLNSEAGDIVAVRQANVFGTSFHPELTGDARIHAWWLEQVVEDVVKRRELQTSS
ncbi:putative pyridoxine protein [Botrytis fragariae]|uniref:glutaminase n=1 Tax=Botrytis fragariae TaxID=1964551 RepID=A0A8H6APA9_9HELO|nr:putative pyridoxine protein [Botrytis fragariae]KAF5871331.1 putative pyridoxine protein [Botrytis fragariae]